MHLSDLLNRLWGAADYAPANSPEGIARSKEYINRALMKLSQDAPFLFERDVDLYLDPDILPNNTNVPDEWRSVVIAPSSDIDPWVLETTWVAASHPLLAARYTSPARPLSGRWMEFVDPSDADGQKILSLRIREVWVDDISGRVRMSLFEPVPYPAPAFIAGGSGLGTIKDWRITMKQYALPPEVIEVQSVMVKDAVNDTTGIRFITASEADRFGFEYAYWDRTSTSMPWVCWQGTVETLVNMNVAPLVAALSGTWSTTAYAEPEGDFEYVYTLSLGERHDEVQDITPLSSTSRVANDLGRRMPYIESPPSPIRTLEQGAASGNNIVVSTSNFPNLIGFGDVSTPRYRRVGIKANLYRRRIKTYGGSLWPSSEHFQHIDTQSFLANGVVFFTDDGETVPGRRLRRSGGYKTLRFSHAPDKPYRLSVRAAIRPFEMKDDADACEVPPGAIDTLISLSLRYLYEASGNPSMAAAAFSDYEVALHALKRRHADIRPPGQTRKIRLRGRRRKGRLYNYTTSAE